MAALVPRPLQRSESVTARPACSLRLCDRRTDGRTVCSA